MAVPKKKSALFILDLDRTLLDVEKVMKLVIRAATVAGIDARTINEQRRDTEKSGKSYSPLATLDIYGQDNINAFKNYFLNNASAENLLYLDAIELVNTLKKKDIDFIILTYAITVDWQKLKIRACGLDAYPNIIISTREKGKVISSWKNSAGLISPPGHEDMSAERVVLVDDRAQAFYGLPENSGGFHIIRQPHELDKKLPVNVEKISSLTKIADGL